jgi:prevent-host-death family protein
MERVPIRELQQHASAVIRRVKAGETLAITERGTLVAVLSPPPPLSGLAALVAAGRVRPGSGSFPLDDPLPAKDGLTTAQVLDDLRADRY